MIRYIYSLVVPRLYAVERNDVSTVSPVKTYLVPIGEVRNTSTSPLLVEFKLITA